MANNNKRGKYSTWTKNFGQSVRFGAKEVLSDIAPSIAETASSLPEEMRELKQDLRKLRANKRQIVNYLLGEEEQFSKYAGLGWKNIKQSARTGKLIDKNREEKMTMAAMGMDDMDFDFDDSGSMDFDTPDASFEDLDMGPSKIVNISGPSTKAMGVVNESIQGTTSAITSGFSSLERSNKNNFAMTEALQRHFHTETMTKVDAISNNLAAMVQFNNDSMSTFVQASMEFYDKNLAVLNSINEAMLRISPPPKEKKERTQYESPVDMFMSGGFSLKGYSRLIAKNTKKAFDDSLIGSMIPLLNNEMILADMASNPLGSLMKLGMESLLPDRFKKSLGNMDKGFKNFIPALLTKFGSYNGNNEMLKLLGSIFGIKTDVKAKRYKQGEYEHGPIPFDGETKVAITRVIPGYLSRQTAILEVIAKSLNKRISDDDLEGSIRERGIVFNYSKDGTSAGSFMRRNEAIKYQRREERDLITREYSDSRYALIDALRNHEGSKNVDRSIDVEDYLVGLTHSNATLRPKDLNQIKRMLWIGSHNGKKPMNDKYLEEIPDSTAEAIMYALSSLEKEDPKDKTNNKHILMGLYGSERHSAKAKLSNYNSSYASDDEYGAGRHEFMSTIHKGSIFDMYTDRADKTVVPKYEIKVNEFGEYYMPQNKLDDFNKFYKVNFKTAKQCYEYYQKKTNKKEGELVTDTTTEDTSFKTFTGEIKALIQAPLNKMADLFDAVNNKMYEVIFGKDGLGGNIEELLLGVKDEKTKRYSGGWFSEAINGVKDTYASTKKYLFGGTDEKGDKVPGILTNTVDKFGSIMNQYFFGEEEKITNPDGSVTTKKKPSIVEKMQTTIVHGFGELASTFFGGGKGGRGRKKSLEQAKQAFNKAIPDIGKGAGIGAVVGTISGFGGFGLLGSLFLPGGPIGGAIVGSAMGLLSQSKDFREMIFGKEVKGKDGKVKRVGGLISEKVQNFFKRKKIPILGGAAMGTISTAMGHGIAFGLMPTIAVGAFGPVIAGAAWGLMSHSKKFREIFFGKEVKQADGTTRRIGGMLNNKMMRSIKIAVPRGLAGALTGMAGMGVLSQFGLIGSMIATGPIPAAIIGAAAGIASGSKKFTQYMFGYTDKSGKYHSGAMDRLKNYFTWEIMEPMKLFISENVFKGKMWVRRYVYAPLREAFVPLKYTLDDIGKYLTDRLKLGVDAISDGFHFVFKTVAEHVASIMKPIIDMTKTMAEWTVRRFKSALSMSIKLALLPLRAMGGLLGWMVKGRDYKSGVLTAARGVGSAIMAGTGVLGAVGNLGKAVLSPDESNDRMKAFRAKEERQRKIEEKAFQKGSMRFADARRRLEEQQRKMRAGGYNLTDEQIEAMRKRELDKGEEMEALKEQINKSDDLGNKMLASISDRQNEANDYLGQVRDMMEAQESFNKSENGLFYTTMAGVHGGLKKLGLGGEEIKGSMTEIIKENITNPQDIANNYLKIIADNSTENLTITKEVADEGETPVGKGGKRKKRNRQIEKAKKLKQKSPDIITDAEGNVYGMISRKRKGGTRDNKLADIYRGKVFGASGIAAATQQEGLNFDLIGGADTSSSWDTGADDNASVTDAKNKLQKLQDKAIDRDEKRTSFLGTIAAYCKKKMAEKNVKSPSWLDKILSWGGSLLTGILAIGSVIGGIATIAGGILSVLSFAFGDNDSRRHQLESNAMGNIARRFAKGGVQLGIGAAKGVRKFFSKELVERKFVGKMYTVGEDGTRKLAGNIYSKAKTRGDVWVEKVKSLVKPSKALGAIGEKARFAASFMEDGGMVKKILEGVSNAIDDVLNGEFMRKHFPRADKLKEFIKSMPGAVKEWFSKKETAVKILSKLKSGSVVGKTVKGIAKTVGGVLTAGGLTAAFAAYDGISGAVDAGFLFEVADEDVDMRMRLISGLVNIIFGLPGMFVMDVGLSLVSIGLIGLGGTKFGQILSELGLSLNKFDHRRIVAQAMYKLTADEADASALDDKQKKLADEYSKYLEANKLDKSQMSLEEYQSKVKKQGGIWQQFGAPILNRIFGVDDPFKEKSFMERISDKFEGLVNWFRNGVDTFIKEPFSEKLFDVFSVIFPPLGLARLAWKGLKAAWNKFGETSVGKRLASWMPGGSDAGVTDEYKDKATKVDKQIESTGTGLTKMLGRDVDMFSADGNGFSQGDSRWKNKAFGSSTFGLEACGPLALANITGKDPRALAAMARVNDFSGSGIKPSYFRRAAGQLGLGYRENNTSQDMYTGLLSGKPMIVGGSSTNPNSPFYGNGHYVVANGLDSKGQANIYNPSGHGKSMSVDPKTLIRESLGHGGYSGSFSGAGRMSLAEAMKGDPKGNMNITTADLRKYNERQEQELEEYRQYLMDNDLSTEDMSIDEYRRMIERTNGAARALKRAEPMPVLKGRAAENKTTSFVDEETAAAADKTSGISAKTDGTTETITHADGSVTTKNTKTGKTTTTAGAAKNSKADGSLSIMDILTGFGLGLANLFSSVWGGGKYKAVTIDDIKNGIAGKFKSLFGSGPSGPVQQRLLESAKSFLNRGIYYSQSNPGRLDPDSSGYTDCSGYTAAIYKKAFGENLLTPYGGEFDDPDRAGQWNESYPIDEKDAQIGDLVFWETANGIPDNHVGMVIDPKSHKAVASNTSTGPAEVIWDDSYWKPMFSGIRRPKVLEELNKKYGGGGGSFDASEGNIDTKKAVWNYLVNDLEMNREGAAGVMGNIEQESRFDTNAYNANDNDGRPSGGLVQWHAGRFNNLKNYAAGIGRDWTDVQSQVGYLGQELNGPYGHVYDRMKNASSVDAAVDTWVRQFEIPADIPGEISRRTPMAEAYYRDHANFVGGANGFMPQGSSSNLFGQTLATGLFAWKQRYDERGRAKKLGALMNQYARTHTPPDVVQATVRNATADRILPAKVDTGGASMDDLLLSIRALDSHAELNQIIAYLAAIAANGGTGKGGVELDRKTEIDLQRNIEMAKRDVREANSHRRLNQQAMGNLENVLGNVEGFPANALALAQEIARGGKFRTS